MLQKTVRLIQRQYLQAVKLKQGN